VHLDIQLSPAHEPWEAVRDGVVVAEEAGYGTAWVFDHFAGAMLGGDRMLECFTLLGALAASTARIGLGTLVANVANRHPAVLAHSAASVQIVSGGRFVLGLGAGAAPGSRWAGEHTDLGITLGATMAERHARVADTLDVLDRLWGPPISDIAMTYPRPAVRPPVVLGVNSEALARMAGARADGINVRAEHPDLAAILAAAVEARARRLDAEPEAPPFQTTVWTSFDPDLGDAGHPLRVRCADLGVDRLVLVVLGRHDPAALRSVTA
jgi:alkanesulfonate monooxygenase SsuD/methylene tetrahydromethanopterin reductase-like flavin-dependent oxidoreductase (luciferase family)